MKRVLAIVLTVVMLIGLCACGGVSLKGTEWKLTSMTTNGLEVDEAFLSELGISGSIVFTDNEVTFSVMGEDQIGTYSIDENVITMVDSAGEQMIATLGENTITITLEELGELVFTKQQ